MSCEEQHLMPSEAIADGEFKEARMQMGGRVCWLIVTRQSGQVRAWLNICPHQGRALNYAPNQFLTDQQGRLICAAHGAVFEADEGQCVQGPCQGASLKAIEITEQDGQITSCAQP